MADSLPALGSAIYSRLGTVVYTYLAGAGTALVTGTLPTFNTMATQGLLPPYVTFQLQSSIDGYAWGNHEEESNDFVVKVVSLRSFLAQEAYPVYGTIHAALQDAPLSVTGFRVMKVRRTSRIQYRDNSSYWHVGGIYRLDLVDT